MRRVLLWSMGLLCAACTSLTPAPPVIEPLPVPVAHAPAPQAAALPAEELSRLMASETFSEGPTDISAPEGMRAVKWANGRATVRPRREWFNGSTLTLPFVSGRLYVIRTTALQPTTFVFPPGEKLRVMPALSEYWDFYGNEAETAQDASYVVVVPKKEGLSERMTIITNVGVYAVLLESSTGEGLVQVQWKHPEVSKPKAPVTYQAHVGYALEAVRQVPSWMPQAAWDRNGKTYIQAHPLMPVLQAPEIFLITQSRQRHPVNAVLQENIYRIDRLAGTGEQFEMRLGEDEKTAEVVHVYPGQSYRQVSCPGPECPAVQP